MAGGSIRANRALRQLGYEHRKPVFGYVTWGLWSSVFFLPALTNDHPRLALLPLIPFFGSYVTGRIQMVRNKTAIKNSPLNTKLQTDVPVRIQVTPFTFGDARGVALQGTF